MLIYKPIEIQKDKEGKSIYKMCAYSPYDRIPHPFGLCAENCSGHATEDEAYDHYKTGELKKIIYLIDPEYQRKCAACGEWTQNRLVLGDYFMEDLALCDKHKNDKELQKKFFFTD